MVGRVDGTIVRLIDMPIVSARGLPVARGETVPDFQTRLSADFEDGRRFDERGTACEFA